MRSSLRLSSVSDRHLGFVHQLRSRLTRCLWIVAFWALAIPAAAYAQAKSGKVIPLIGGNALVTIYPSSDNVTVSGSTTHTYQFDLGNSGTGNTTATLSTPTCSGAVSGCSVSPTSVSLPANGAGAVATVSYTAAATGTGTIILNANWPSGNNVQGTLTVTVQSATPAVSVSPNPNYSAESFATNDPNFSVKNNGNTASTYNLSVDCSGNISACSVGSPSASVSPGSSTAATVYYTTGPWTSGNGTATLTATSVLTGQSTNTAVTVVPLSPAVSVTPDGGTPSPEPGVGANVSVPFTVTDVGNSSPTTYSLVCGYSGVVTSCSVTPSVQVYIGSPQTVTVSYTTSTNTAGGTGQVTLTATAGGPQVHTYSDAGNYNVAVADARTYTPVVTPKGSPTGQASPYTLTTYKFAVKNTGDTQASYTLTTPTCTGTSGGCSVTSPITVNPGQTDSVAVSFTTGAAGQNVALDLHAAMSAHGVTFADDGTASINVSYRLQVSTAFMNNDDQDMSLCAASCFAMTAARSTVPYYTLDAPRNVTLVYNGDRAFPRPFIYADVSDSTAPSSISSYTLEVKRLGVDLPFVNGETKLTFQGTSSPATTYRLAGQIDMSSYATNVDSVTLVVTAYYTNGESDVTPVKTQLMWVNSTLNTQAAPIAKGWRIAGMQYFRGTPEGIGSSGGGYMIENGDGSATYFAYNGAIGADLSTLAYDNVSKWIRTYQDGSKVAFDGGGRMLYATDRLGRETQFIYGGTGNWKLVGIIEPMRSSGHSTSAPYDSLTYDGNGNLSAIIETGGTGGRTTSVTVDGSGHLTRITDPDGGYDSYGYDGSGRLSTITDRRGNTTTYNYGLTWKLSSVVSPSVPIDAGGGTTTMGTPTTNISPWQAIGVPFDTTAITPAALTLPANVLAIVTDPKNDTTRMYPDRWGELLKTVDALGNTTTIQRSGFLPTVITHPDGSVDSASYYASGLLQTQHSAGQQTVSYTYGNMNQLQSESGSGVVTVTNVLDSLGRTIKTTYGTVTGDTTIFKYDSVTKNVASMFRPDTGLVTYQYDSKFGNSSTETDPGSRVTQSYFDNYGRDTADKAPQYPMTKTVYDVLNRVTAQYNGVAANPIRIAYDALLPVSVRDPLSHVDSTEYDAAGNVARHFGYASATVPTTMRYDLASRPTSVTNRRGQEIDVTYDPLGRVLTKTADSATDHFTYSANGLIQTAYNATDTVRTVSVPSALLDTVQTTMAATGVTSHIYTIVHRASSDAGGTDSTTISSNGAPAQFVTRRYVNDAASGMLSAINLGSSIGQGSFTYDAASRRVATAWPTAGSSSYYLSTGTRQYRTYGTLDPSFYVGYAVDSAGRILRDHRHYGSPTAYSNRVFGYDALGRYTGRDSLSDATYPWFCGGSGRFDPNYGEFGCAIDSVMTPNSYAYDDAENRVGGGIHYGVGDEVTSSDGFSYTYDADGNVATRTQSSTGSVWTYNWSSDNRLLSASTSLYGIPSNTVSFDYDALGEPVVKRGSTGQVTRVTLYDGGQILADLDSSGHREAEYVYDAGTDAPYAMLTGTDTVSAVRYYAQDDLGNVQGQFADYTRSTETVSYGDWGLPTVSGETANRLTWKGLSYDPDVGLTYVRARWYDPNIGRFVSEDPAGLQGGINPYVFANNDPINGADPSGADPGYDDSNNEGSGDDGGSCTYTVRYQYPLLEGNTGLAGAIPGTVEIIGMECPNSGVSQGPTPSSGATKQQPKPTLPPCAPPAARGNVTYKFGIPTASPAVANFMTCTSACMGGATFRASSTSEAHSLADPHTRGFAVDGEIPGSVGQIFQCAANCGAVFQLNEYTNPSPHATAGHYHFQLVPGKNGATGPYYARCTYATKP